MKKVRSLAWLTASMAAFLGVVMVLYTTPVLAALPLGNGGQDMVQGAERMVKGEQMLAGPLQKQELMKSESIRTSFDQLKKGEKMVTEGKTLFMKPDTRVQGKEMMYKGSTEMMQAKDAIMQELGKDQALKTGKLASAWSDLVQGEYEMMEGKNLMLRGWRLFE